MTDVEKNKDVVIRFYNALAQGDVATLEELARPDYIQHNPLFETGIQGLVKMIGSWLPRAADAPSIPPLEFVRIIAEGDFVMTLRRILLRPERNLPPDKEMANVDIFRLHDSKVAEHWDYQERFPRGIRLRKTRTVASSPLGRKLRRPRARRRWLSSA